MWDTIHMSTYLIIAFKEFSTDIEGKLNNFARSILLKTVEEPIEM